MDLSASSQLWCPAQGMSPLDTSEQIFPNPTCPVLLDTSDCIIPKLLSSLFSFFHLLFTTLLSPSLFPPK